MPSLSTPAAAQTAADQTTIGFLSAPEATADTRQIFDEDVAELGYVMNASRLWAYQPATATGLFNLVRQATPRRVTRTRQPRCCGALTTA